MGATSSTYTSLSWSNFYVVGQTTEGCSVTSDEISLNMISISAVSEFEVDNTTATTASLDWDNASPTNVYNISYSSDGGLSWIDIRWSCRFIYIHLSGLTASQLLIN